MRLAPAPLPVLALLLAAAAGCASADEGGSGGLFSWLQGETPNARALRLQRLHDPKTFAHTPDTPATGEACLETIRAMGVAEYTSWPDVGEAVFLLTRAATEDPSALGRGEALGALSRMGAMLAEAEAPAMEGNPRTEPRAAAARLEEIHPGEKALHVSPEAAAECAELLRGLGAVRVPLAPEGGKDALRAGLDTLRRALRAVIVATRAAEEHSDPDVRADIDRAVVELGSRAVRATLVAAGLHDPDERVRGSAWDALGPLAWEGIAAVLRRAYVTEGIAAVRRQIVQALGHAASRGPGADRDDAVPLLILALDDDDRSVGFNARESLGILAGEDLGDRPEAWKNWWAGLRATK